MFVSHRPAQTLPLTGAQAGQASPFERFSFVGGHGFRP